MTVGLLLVALVKLVYCPPGRRAFWVGFAILGWGYLLVDRVVMQFPAVYAEQLATVRLLHVLGRATMGDPGDPLISYAPVPMAYPTLSPGAAPLPNYSPADPTYGSTLPDGFDPPPSDVGAPPSLEGVAAPGTSGVADAPPDAYGILPSGTGYAVPQGTGSVSFTAPTDPALWQRFILIGQYLWALVLGLCGGLLASYFQSRSCRESPPRSVEDG